MKLLRHFTKPLSKVFDRVLAHIAAKYPAAFATSVVSRIEASALTKDQTDQLFSQLLLIVGERGLSQAKLTSISEVVMGHFVYGQEAEDLVLSRLLDSRPKRF